VFDEKFDKSKYLDIIQIRGGKMTQKKDKKGKRLSSQFVKDILRLVQTRPTSLLTLDSDLRRRKKPLLSLKGVLRLEEDFRKAGLLN